MLTIWVAADAIHLPGQTVSCHQGFAAGFTGPGWAESSVAWVWISDMTFLPQSRQTSSWGCVVMLEQPCSPFLSLPAILWAWWVALLVLPWLWQPGGCEMRGCSQLGCPEGEQGWGRWWFMPWLHGALSPIPVFVLQCLYVPKHSSSSFPVLQPKTRVLHSELMGHCEHKSASGYFVPEFCRSKGSQAAHILKCMSKASDILLIVFLFFFF